MQVLVFSWNTETIRKFLGCWYKPKHSLTYLQCIKQVCWHWSSLSKVSPWVSHLLSQPIVKEVKLGHGVDTSFSRFVWSKMEMEERSCSMYGSRFDTKRRSDCINTHMNTFRWLIISKSFQISPNTCQISLRRSTDISESTVKPTQIFIFPRLHHVYPIIFCILHGCIYVEHLISLHSVFIPCL